MENQSASITGYRPLTGNEIADINSVKMLGEEIERLAVYLEQSDNGYDKRWLAIGATQLQQGLMALTRAVARPTTF